MNTDLQLEKMKKAGSILFFISILISISFLIFKSNSDRDGIKKNGIVTIVKYSFIEKYGKLPSKFIKYYANNKFYRTKVQHSIGFEYAKLGKYYTAKFSKLNPENTVVDFTQEVTDTSAIIESGFSKEEILGKPRSYNWDWPK